MRVVDYIHLNPVRAGVVTLEHLDKYQRSSFPKWFKRKSQRPACLQDERWRKWAGYETGERELRRYWADLALKRECKPEEHERLLGELCSGWYIGARQWAMDLLERFEKTGHRVDANTQAEETEDVWEAVVQHYLSKEERTDEDLRGSRKSEPWKLELAWKIKSCSGVTNAWLARRLNLGHPCAASNNIIRWRSKVQNI